ncbi:MULTISPECIES: long-chain fatty acid--CoA ligase [unclassified Pseudonocardia]|uniref:long-chain fatty acid--CoA ligase n=1 Tax=unclassified Pseudonocardia TaxID=2619320 RepID=UPI0004924F7F|nr:long-chain fatty acid--CoA ligase [Pseudonocardia sp. Ae707_Ps1]OLM09027.1 3-methylmercaptopropionyl-CoA ligase (DmdB) [Pseudonocardia sp. Ae707_Ps1]
MDSTMQQTELLVADLLEHGARVHAEARVVHYDGGPSTDTTFADVADEAARLAGGLRELGVGRDDVVATLSWNTPAHLVAYFAVPAMGAVLHTLNLRLSDDQLIYIVNHAEDRVVLVGADLTPQLARILPRCPSVTDVIVVGPAEAELSGVRVLDYDTLVARAEPVRRWPQLPERSAAVLCYTTGTTGDPKGVAYSHRSIYLHTLAISTGSAFGFSDADRVLPIVPMFHANAWGWPYAAWVAGAALIMTDRYLQAEHLAQIITEHRPTAAAAVPTLWTALDAHGVKHDTDFSSLRLGVVGGSPLSAALVESFAAHHGLRLTQGWGMTETSPLLTFSRPPAGTAQGEGADVAYRARTGRLVPGVRARAVDEQGSELPWDGESAGEIELRGATIAGSYFRASPAAIAEKFRDGWLRTGDLGVIHPSGWVELKDRLKDGIKSGGEWISSVELENQLAAHPAVAEVVVIGVPDPQWEERPLVCVRLRQGADASPAQLREFLHGKVARWWLPERWAFVDEIPKTSVGKLDKKTVRATHGAGRFDIVEINTIAKDA